MTSTPEIMFSIACSVPTVNLNIFSNHEGELSPNSVHVRGKYTI